MSLLRAAQHNHTIPDRLKETFFVHAFHKASAQYVSAFRAVLSKVRSHNQSLLASSEFDDFHFLRYLIQSLQKAKSRFRIFS